MLINGRFLPEALRRWEQEFGWPLEQDQEKAPEGLWGRLPVAAAREGDIFKIRAQAPGFEKEEISVEIDGNELTIRAERKTVQGAEGSEASGALESELMGPPRLVRALRFAEELDEQSAKASLKNGILSVEIAPKKKAASRRVEIL